MTLVSGEMDKTISIEFAIILMRQIDPNILKVAR